MVGTMALLADPSPAEGIFDTAEFFYDAAINLLDSVGLPEVLAFDLAEWLPRHRHYQNEIGVTLNRGLTGNVAGFACPVCGAEWSF